MSPSELLARLLGLSLARLLGLSLATLTGNIDLQNYTASRERRKVTLKIVLKVASKDTRNITRKTETANKLFLKEINNFAGYFTTRNCLLDCKVTC